MTARAFSFPLTYAFTPQRATLHSLSQSQASFPARANTVKVTILNSLVFPPKREGGRERWMEGEREGGKEFFCVALFQLTHHLPVGHNTGIDTQDLNLCFVVASVHLLYCL